MGIVAELLAELYEFAIFFERFAIARRASPPRHPAAASSALPNS